MQKQERKQERKKLHVFLYERFTEWSIFLPRIVERLRAGKRESGEWIHDV